MTARCCYLFVPVHLPEAQTFFLSSASLPAGIYCWSKRIVAAVVVMVMVMLVNVVVGIIEWMGGCLWLFVVGWTESCLWLLVTAWTEWSIVVACVCLG